MVNRVLASCYPSSNHDLDHIIMAPIRWLPEIIQWIFGEENGFSTYIRINEDLGKWISPDKKI